MRRLLIPLLLAFPLCSSAGPFIEPFAGYETGKVESTLVVAGIRLSGSSNISGPAYGARVGLASATGFAFGGEAEGANLGSGGASVSGSDYGPFLQFRLPLVGVGFRGAYFVKSKLGSASGKGYKIGGGFRLAPHVRFNLDYIERKFDVPEISVGIISARYTGKVKTLQASISFPFGG